ncbi:hypothetical protein PG985_000099 [Apiospora marii]|uniref:uncharacterized protein n=1 Tax=Apiospora marii TaxID=335849 RepID=UPI003131E15B
MMAQKGVDASRSETFESYVRQSSYDGRLIVDLELAFGRFANVVRQKEQLEDEVTKTGGIEEKEVGIFSSMGRMGVGLGVVGVHWPGDQGPSGFIDVNQVSLGMVQALGGEGDNPSALRLAGLLSQRRPNSSPKQNGRPHTSSDRLPHPAAAGGKKFNGRTLYLHHQHAMRYDGKNMARH